LGAGRGVAAGDTWQEGGTTTCAGVRAASGTHTANIWLKFN